MAAAEELALLQGTLDLLILKTLAWGPQHGYAVARWIRECSDESLIVEDRALYLALHRLEEREFVEAEWGLSDNNRKAKYYAITTSGRQQLKARSTQWTRYAEAVFKVLAARKKPA